jgi:hypothetical protein
MAPSGLSGAAVNGERKHRVAVSHMMSLGAGGRFDAMRRVESEMFRLLPNVIGSRCDPEGNRSIAGEADA